MRPPRLYEKLATEFFYLIFSRPY